MTRVEPIGGRTRASRLRLAARLPFRVPGLAGGILSRPGRGASLHLGRGVQIGEEFGIYLDGPGATITIGEDSVLHRRVELNCQHEITIGKRCHLAWEVQLMDTDFHPVGDAIGHGAIVIGDDVSIGVRVTILKDVTIGDGAIVRPGSLVTKNVAAGETVAGIPARPITP